MMIPVLFLLEILSIIGNVLKGLLQFVVDVFPSLLSVVCASPSPPLLQETKQESVRRGFLQ